MHSGVVDIAATCRPVSFLFVEDVVLGTSLNSSVLDTLDGVVSGFSGEVRVTASHFPLSAWKETYERLIKGRKRRLTRGSDTSTSVHARTQCDVDALASKLSPNREGSLVHQLPIECRSSVESRTECRHSVGESNTEGCILEAQSIESDSFDRGDVTDASTVCPSHSSRKVHFLFESKLSDEGSSLLDGVGPVSLASGFGRRVERRRERVVETW
jgi:hypothetical protein